MTSNVADLLIRARMEVSDVETGVGQIQKALKGLTLPKGLSDDLEKSFSKLTPLLKDYHKQLGKVSSGSFSKKDLQNFEAIRGKVNEVFGELRGQISSINGREVRLKVDTKEITSLEKKMEGVSNNLKNQLANVFTKGVNTDSINKMMTDIANTASKSKNIQSMSGKAQELFNTQQYAAYNAELDKMKAKILSLNSTKTTFGQQFIKNFDDIKDKPKELQDAFDKFFNSLKVNDTKVQRIEDLKQQLADLGVQLDAKQIEALNNALNTVGQQNSNINNLGNSFEKIGSDINGAGSEIIRFQDELGQLQSSTQYFFSLRNMLNLFKRGVQEAVETVKDLDAAMAETAVVTKYSVSDMWGKLPEYTANAKALGSTIQDMYEATTLYYQQGLNSEQAMGIASETMKMARIGGLEAADATDKMTAALRGFHMELNEASAQRVNDVYSNLAAKTASNTEELGNAMQRTASIAANAGMSFEGTAAFLAQAIETTREPAENIGTAMKTIIARMQEMKKNPLEISEVDGEEVDYNKIDAALRSVGISLKATNGAFRDNDEVLLDISQKWDSLTQTQQRYIATTIAGSRQQSRFIAMVGDYDRTMELMGYANDSAGASAEQFGKLEESLEFKTNKLKDTWQEFLMSIANEGAIKSFVSGADTILTGVNKIISVLAKVTGPAEGLTKSVLSLGTAFMGLRGFGRLSNGLIRGFGGMLDPSSGGFGEQFKLGISNSRTSLQAAAISNPIVNAIRQAVGDLIPHIDKDAEYSGNTMGPGNAKKAKEDLDKQLGIESKGLFRGRKDSTSNSTYTPQNVLDIMESNQLTPNQQKHFFDRNPGLKRNLKISLGNLLKDVGADEQTKEALVKGFTSGRMPLKEVLESPALKKTWGEQYQEIIDQYGSDAWKKGGEGRQAIKDLKEQAGAKSVEDLKEGGELYEAGPVSEWASQIHELSDGEQSLQSMADNAERVSGGIMAAGTAFTMVGSIVGDVNEDLGKTLTNVGSIMTAIGGLGMAVSTFMNMNPVLMGISAAIGAIATVSTLAKKRIDGIKKAGEEVTKTYEEINTSTQENISTLKSYQEQSEYWSKGVDEFGNNVSLSDDEYAAYREAVNKIAEINPGIVEGYNAQGQAIVNINEALKETIKLEAQRQKNARDEYLDEGALDKIVKARNLESGYVNATRINPLRGSAENTWQDYLVPDKIEKWDEKISNWLYSQFGIDVGLEISAPYASDTVDIVRSLKKDLGDEKLSEVLEPFNIDLEKLSKGDANSIKQLVKNREQIYSAALSVSEDGLSEKTTQVFNNLDDSVKAAEEAVEPTLKWLKTSISQSTIFQDLPEELKSSVMTGLEEIALDPTISFDSMESEAIKLVDGLKSLTKEGSAFSNIMEDVAKEQDKFLENLDAKAYDNNIKDELADLDSLMKEYADDTTAYGRAVYEYLKNQKAAIESFTTSGGAMLSDAINGVSGIISEAEGAYANFQEATKTDFSTGKENMKSIYDELFKTDDRGVQSHLEGSGDRTLWRGAEDLLGRDYLIDKKIDSVSELRKELEKLGPYLEEGEQGFANFWDAFMEIDYSKIEGLTIDKEKGTYEIADGMADQVYDAIAEQKGWSKTFLISMLNAGRQYGSIDFTSDSEVRKALSTDESVLRGTDKEGNGVLITTNDYLNSALEENNMTLPEQEKWKENHQEEVGLVTIDNLDELSKETAEAVGITDMRSAIEVLGNSGLFDSQQIEEFAKANNLEGYTPENFEGAWKQYLDRQTDPTLAPIESIESNVARIANSETLKDIKEGNVTENDLKDAKDYKENILGGEGVDTATQYFGQGKNQYGNALNAEEYREGRDNLKEGAAYAEQMRKAYEEAAKNAPDKESRKIAKEAAEYYEKAEKSINNNLKAADKNYANTYAEEQKQKALERYMQEEDMSLEQAEKEAEEVFEKAKKVAQDFIDSNGEGDLEETVESDSETKRKKKKKKDKSEEETDESIESEDKDWEIPEDVKRKYNSLVTNSPLSEGLAKLDLASIAQDEEKLAALGRLTSVFEESTLPGQSDLDLLGLSESWEGVKEDYLKAIQESVTPDKSDTPEPSTDTSGNKSGKGASEKGKEEAEQAGKEAGEEMDNAYADGLSFGNGSHRENRDSHGRETQPSNEYTGPTKKEDVTVTTEADAETDEATQELDDFKEKVIEVKGLAEEGITLSIKVPGGGTDKLAKAAKAAEIVTKNAGDKSFSVTANASGTEETNDLTDAVKAFNKTTSHTVYLVASLGGASPSDISDAIDAIDDFHKKTDHTVNLTTNIRTNNDSGSSGKKKSKNGRRFATGTHNHGYASSPSFNSAAKGYGQVGPKGKGGPTLTGELGYEIAWIPSENRSMILGANGPQMVDLPGDAVVWTHEQSKKILKQKAIPAGSMSDGQGSYQGSSDGDDGGGDDKKDSSHKSHKGTGSSQDEANVAAISRIIVWWDNITRRADAVQRKADKNQKKYEKYLKEIQATLKTTGTKGGGNAFISNTNKAIDLYKKERNRAKADLRNFSIGTKSQRKAWKTGSKKDDKKARRAAFNAERGGAVQISYETGKGDNKKTKNKIVSTAKYIKPKDGSYVIDQKQLNRIKNKSERKALADALNKEINDRISKRNTAIDNIEKAQEALEKFSQDLYDNFFGWETELTKIWNITQKIEAIANRIERSKGYSELLSTKLATGMAQAGGEFSKQTLAAFKKGVFEQSEQIKQTVASIGEKKNNLKNLLSLDDEKATLKNVQNKLVKDIKSDATIKKTNKKIDKEKKKQKDWKKEKKELTKEQKKAKTKAEKAKIQRKIDRIDSQIQTSEKKVKTYKQTIKKANKNNLNSTQKLGYEKQAKELEKDINTKAAAWKYLNVKKRADGTLDLSFNSEKFEKDKQKGIIGKEKAEGIQEYVKKLVDANKELNEEYENVVSQTTEMYGTLQTLQEQWEGYANELWQISDEQAKRELDNAKKLSDSITKAIKDLLDEVKKKLDERRKKEDNAKTEQEISRKQQRLTMLRADTSGGHQVEIAQLEQEIADAQQSYERTLEDQLLEKLQDQADLAAKQRERQIELQEALLETTNNAALVDMWMTDPAKFKNEIWEAYKEANDYDKKPKALQQGIERDFNELYDGLLNNQKEQDYVKKQIDILEEQKDYLKAIKESFSSLGEKASSTNVKGDTGVRQNGTEAAERDAEREANKGNKSKSKGNTAGAGGGKHPIASAGSKNPYGTTSAISGNITSKSSKKSIQSLKWSLKQLGYYNGTFSGDWGPKTKKAIIAFKKSVGLTANTDVGPKTKAALKKKGYRTGGLADYTGPAWLDGTPSKPELVLNAKDTQNFIALRDVLSKAMSSTSAVENTYGGDAMYEININVDKIEKDYDVDRVVDKVKKEITKNAGYRNVTQVRNFR